MTTPNDVVIVMWITLPFLLASLVFTFRKCVTHLTQLRVGLVFAILLAIIANSILIANLGYRQTNFNVMYLLGVTAYNLSLWSSRLYVCLRMSKLLPSPAVSTSFHHLAYIGGTLFMMTEVAYVMNAIEFYRTHPSEVPAVSNDNTFASNVVANLMFQIASIYLHVKSLKMFASSNTTGIKLYILSCSTLVCAVFGFVQSSVQFVHDVSTELMMAGIQVAVLPSSIVLGEAIAIRVGRVDSRSSGSHPNTTGSQANKTTTSFINNVDKRSPYKTEIPMATISMDKMSPILQTPVLIQPSI